MKKKNPTPFNVIVEDINKREFVYYDIMPYLMRCYDEVKKKRVQPKSFDEFKKFVEGRSMYMYWGRCQYELVLKPLVGHDNEQKADVHWQLMHNLELVTSILMLNLGFKENNGL